MAVVRGKFSEGFNFKDDLCRGVFMIGVPNLNITSAKIQLKSILYGKLPSIKDVGDIPLGT